MVKSTVQLPFAAADPYILHASDGMYYLYCTREGGGAFPIYASPDLMQWEERGEAIGPVSSKWGVQCFWAPECYEFGGRYYLFYSADWKENPRHSAENFRIGVAAADTPCGPFEDLYDRPIFDPGYPIIDGNVYTEDGRYYLYYSRCCFEHQVDGLEESWIYGVELRPDFGGVIGEPRLLLRPEQPWEGRSAKATGRRWNEGSFLFRREGRYFMTYSGNFFAGPDYAVGYAVGASPLGTFVKAKENPILQCYGEVTGTGHSCMLHDDTGCMLICYHGRTQKTGNDRIVFLSPVVFSKNGCLRVIV